MAANKQRKYKHPRYGHMAHVYWNKHYKQWEVRFIRNHQYFFGGRHDTVEEALKVRNAMYKIVPPPNKRKAGVKAGTRGEHTSWTLHKWKNKEEQIIVEPKQSVQNHREE